MTSFTKNYGGAKGLKILKNRILVDGFHIVIDLAKSRGATIHNELDNKKYLSFYSLFASLPVGFNHPGLKNRAYLKALHETAAVKLALSDIYSKHFARFVDLFDRIALRGKFKHLFFIEGGALAVENALKVAFDWKTRLNIQRGKNIEADQILHFKDCFHGRSGYTLSLTDSPDPRKTQYFPKFPWPRIFNPSINVSEGDKETETILEREERAIGEIKNHLKKFGQKTAAIIIEPIQSEGGDNHFRGEFLKELRRLCDENDLLLIFDEIQTGFGATGKWWCWEHFGVKPDIMVFGKKVQVGGIAATERIDQMGIQNCFKVSSRINSTFGGNLVDMVRATRYIEIIRDYDLLKNIREREKQFLAGFRRLSRKYPLANIRGLGGLLAFDAPSEALRQKILKIAMEKERLILLPSGKKTIRFRPSLSITQKEVEEGLHRLDSALRRVFFS